jgi:peroxiredoxin
MLTGQWTRPLLPLVAILLAAALGNGDQRPSGQLQVPDLTGRQVQPLNATDAKATVFFFIRTDCPISNRYAPEVRRLYEKFAPGGVTFWLVYLEADESVETIHKHLKEYEYPLDVLRDARHTLVKMTGVRVTPETAVFVPQQPGHRMVYRGRIDNRFVAFGKTRPAPTTHDLEQVLEAIMKGRPVPSRTTPAIGCFISHLHDPKLQ